MSRVCSRSSLLPNGVETSQWAHSPGKSGKHPASICSPQDIILALRVAKGGSRNPGMAALSSVGLDVEAPTHPQIRGFLQGSREMDNCVLGTLAGSD